MPDVINRASVYLTVYGKNYNVSMFLPYDLLSPKSERNLQLLYHANDEFTEYSKDRKLLIGSLIQFDATNKAKGTHAALYQSQAEGSEAYILDDAIDDYRFRTEEFTVEAYVYPTALTVDETYDPTIISLGYPWEAGSWSIRVTTAGKPVFHYNIGGTQYSIEASGTPMSTLNQLYHVALIKKGNVIRLFIDGVQVFVKFDYRDYNYQGSQVLVIGALKMPTGDVAGGWLGTIDEVRAFKGKAHYIGHLKHLL
jgi:hypothetical protein